MTLNPRLARVLETYEPNRLKAILMWFNADSQTLSTQSETLNAMLTEVQHMNMETCYQLASQLELNELVDLSILNEFGPTFADKSSFVWLSQHVSHRLVP